MISLYEVFFHVLANCFEHPGSRDAGQQFLNSILPLISRLFS